MQSETQRASLFKSLVENRIKPRACFESNRDPEKKSNPTINNPILSDPRIYWMIRNKFKNPVALKSEKCSKKSSFLSCFLMGAVSFSHAWREDRVFLSHVA